MEFVVILALAVVVFGIGVGITIWAITPFKKPGRYTYTIYQPEGTKLIESEDVELNVFEKIDLPEITLDKKVDGDSVSLYYSGTKDGRTFFEASRHFQHRKYKIVAASLNGNELTIETKRDLPNFIDNFFWGVCVSLVTASVIALFASLIWDLLEYPCW